MKIIETYAPKDRLKYNLVKQGTAAILHRVMKERQSLIVKKFARGRAKTNINWRAA